MIRFVKINNLDQSGTGWCRNRVGVITEAPNPYGYDVTVALSGSPHTLVANQDDQWGFMEYEITRLTGAQ
jgi:hypothetical protein